MRSFLIALFIVTTSSAVLASEPGERIGPGDFIFFVDGLLAESVSGPRTEADCSDTETFDPFLCVGRALRNPGAAIQADAEGTLYTWARSVADGNDISQLRRNGAVELIATFPSVRESGTGAVVDAAEIASVTIDQTNGFMYLIVDTICAGDGCDYEPARELIRIRGLKPLAEVLKEQKRAQGRPEQSGYWTFREPARP